MKKPSLEGTTKEQQAYIEYLEKQITVLDSDARYKLLKSLNKGMNELADSLDGIKISIDGEDKVFERFLKTFVDGKEMWENFKWMKEQLGVTNIQEVEEKINPIEKRATNKRREGSH